LTSGALPFAEPAAEESSEPQDGEEYPEASEEAE